MFEVCKSPKEMYIVVRDSLNHLLDEQYNPMQILLHDSVAATMDASVYYNPLADCMEILIQDSATRQMRYYDTLSLTHDAEKIRKVLQTVLNICIWDTPGLPTGKKQEQLATFFDLSGEVDALANALATNCHQYLVMRTRRVTPDANNVAVTFAPPFILPDKLTQILFDTAKAPVLEAFVTQTDSLDVFTVAANNYVELSKKLARINGHAYIFENGKFTENLTLIARNDK